MKRPTRLLIALLVALAFATGAAVAHTDHGHPHARSDAQHGEQHDHDDDHGHAELAGVRLLVASDGTPELAVLDARDGDLLARFTTPGQGVVYGLPNARFAAVVHRDADRVTFVHSGLSVVDHGDHTDLLEGPPYVLKTVNVGRQPSHFFARGHDIAVFNDADGSMVWLDARLLGISLDFAEVPGTAPDHGSLAVLDGRLLGGSLQAGTVTVYARDGSALATFDGCPRLHGQAVRGRHVAFGCSDGVLLIEAERDGTFSAHKVTNPAGSADGARVGTLVADEDADRIVGDFGSGFALIDPRARTMTTFELPTAPSGMRFADHGAMLVVLTQDGSLHDIDPTSGAVRRTVDVAHAVRPGTPRPALAVLGQHAFVTDPDHARVVVIDLHDMVVGSNYELPFTPGGVAVLAIPGAVVH